MQLMSIFGPLIYAGCFAATLSTALTNLLSVPRLIQALGKDRIYPGLIFFAKGYGKHGEPYRGYVLTFIVSVLFLLIGKFITKSKFKKNNNFKLGLTSFSGPQLDCSVDFHILSGLVCSHQLLHFPCGFCETLGMATHV